VLCFEHERLVLITGKLEKSRPSIHRQFEHSRVDAIKLYKLTSKEFMSVCSVDGLVDECRQLTDVLSRVSESKQTRKVRLSVASRRCAAAGKVEC
jgi:hypothetical protein